MITKTLTSSRMCVNVGTQQTTITRVFMYAFANWRDRWRNKPSDTLIVDNKLPVYPLPHVIEAGRTFMSMIVQNERVEKLSRERLLFVGIIHSTRDRPILARVRPIAAKAGGAKPEVLMSAQ